MDGGRTLNNRIRCSGWQVQRPVELQFEETWMSFHLIGVAFICFGEQRGWSLSIQWAQKEVEGGGGAGLSPMGAARRPAGFKVQCHYLRINFFSLFLWCSRKRGCNKSQRHTTTQNEGDIVVRVDSDCVRSTDSLAPDEHLIAFDSHQLLAFAFRREFFLGAVADFPSTHHVRSLVEMTSLELMGYMDSGRRWAWLRLFISWNLQSIESIQTRPTFRRERCF